MAAINNSELSVKPKAGFGKSKRHSLNIDMTPMVDLGFLLITFFIFTSQMAEPTALSLNVPADGPDMPIKVTGVFTIIPAEKEVIYYYEGFFEKEKIKKTNLKEIRNLLMNKKQTTPAADLFVIIKPAKTSSYGQVVDILDEMLISAIPRYALTEISASEELMIK